MNDPSRIALDLTLVGIALVGAVVFVIFERPRAHVALLLFIAICWGIELSFVTSRAEQAATLFARWHPIASFATTVAVITLLVSRYTRPGP